jgi:hypothetical protein
MGDGCAVLCTIQRQLGGRALFNRFSENVNCFERRVALEDLADRVECVALRSPLEDFECTTLGAIPGLLGKLHYLATLHDGRGVYSHWGMARVHGEEAARQAICASHTAVLAQVLRAPLRVLDEDLKHSAYSVPKTAAEFLLSLKQLGSQVLPERPVQASEKHLMAVLRALSGLVANQERANHQDASPPPLLVQ